MAGEARTNAFSLAAATVMLGTQSELFNLEPDQNSIGLVKNFTATASPTFTNLTQGVEGNIVASVMTNNVVKATCEAYEYTARNIAYALSLDGGSLTLPPGTTASDWTGGVQDTSTELSPYGVDPTSANPFGVLLTNAAIAGSTTTPVVSVVVNDPNGTSTTAYSALAQNAWIAIQHPTKLDQIHVAPLSAAATAVAATSPALGYNVTMTLTTGYGITGTYPTGSKVWLVNSLQVGGVQSQVYVAAKVTANLPATQQPVTLLFPKVRIIRGFNLTFDTEKFAAMPLEFEMYNLTPTDPFYTLFGGAPGARGMVLTAS